MGSSGRPLPQAVHDEPRVRIAIVRCSFGPQLSPSMMVRGRSCSLSALSERRCRGLAGAGGLWGGMTNAMRCLCSQARMCGKVEPLAPARRLDCCLMRPLDRQLRAASSIRSLSRLGHCPGLTRAGDAAAVAVQVDSAGIAALRVVEGMVGRMPFNQRRHRW